MAKIKIDPSLIQQQRTQRQVEDPYRDHLDSLQEQDLVERNQKYLNYKNGEYQSTKEAFVDVFNGPGAEFFCQGLEDVVSGTKLLDSRTD
jgi:hypothetical protein